MPISWILVQLRAALTMKLLKGSGWLLSTDHKVLSCCGFVDERLGFFEVRSSNFDGQREQEIEGNRVK